MKLCCLYGSAYSIYKISNNLFYYYLLVPSFTLLFYLGKILMPIKLSMFYPHPLNVINGNALPLVLKMANIFITVLATIVFFLSRYNRKIMLASMFFLITMMPVISFMNIESSIAADRFIYIPSIGIFYLLSELFYWLFSNISKRKKLKVILVVIFIILVAFLSLTAWNRCRQWKDDLALWSDVIAKYPRSLVPYHCCGVCYINKGKYAKALESYNKGMKYALPGSKTHIESLINRSASFLKLGFDREAVDDLSIVLRDDPDNAMAYNNRGIAYKNLKDYNMALSDLGKAVILNKSNSQSLLNRGEIYFNLGDYEKAMNDYNSVIERDHSCVEAYYNLGQISMKTGKYEMAVAFFSKAVLLKPEWEILYYNRGVTLCILEKYKEAIDDFTEVIKLNPDLMDAYYNRALAYLKSDLPEKSMEDIRILKSRNNYKIDPRILKDINDKITGKKR